GQTRDVCTHSLGLSRLIDDKNLRGRNLVRARQSENWITNLWIGQGGVLIKNRFDQNRRRYVSDRDQDDSKYRSPYPPGAFCRLKNAVQNRERDSQNDDSNLESVERFTKPCPKGLIGHSILMLSHETFVKIQRKIQYPRNKGKSNCVNASLNWPKSR